MFLINLIILVVLEFRSLVQKKKNPIQRKRLKKAYFWLWLPIIIVLSCLLLYGFTNAVIDADSDLGANISTILNTILFLLGFIAAFILPFYSWYVTYQALRELNEPLKQPIRALSPEEKKVERYLRLITRAGDGSYQMGFAIIIISSGLLLLSGPEGGDLPSYLVAFIIILLLGTYFIMLGRSIRSNNQFLLAKLWILLMSTILVSGGIIPLIVLVWTIIAIHSVHKIKKLDASALEKRVAKLDRAAAAGLTVDEKEMLIRRGYSHRHNVKNVFPEVLENLSKRELESYLEEGMRVSNYRKHALSPTNEEKISGDELRVKLEIIKLGFKHVNNFSVATEDIEKMPEKELDKYYQAGLRMLK